MAADEGGSSAITMREYRKGNWTLQETMVLIEAKSMDDERRMKKQIGGGEQGKPTELRWKWVEDYCWKRDCFRSQNQCNDKWDNLMRDYKKVRDYQRRFGDDHQTSYWNIDKTQRKDMNLPTCMSSQIYEALAEVVERAAGGRGGRSQRRMLVAGAGGSNSAANSTIAHTSSSRYLTEKATGSSPPPLVLQHSIMPASTPGLTPPPPDPPAHPQPPTQLPLPYFYSLSQPPAATAQIQIRVSTIQAHHQRGGGEGDGEAVAQVVVVVEMTREQVLIPNHLRNLALLSRGALQPLQMLFMQVMRDCRRGTLTL